MRNFSKSLTLLFALLVLSQAAFAQADTSKHNFAGYQNYSNGYSALVGDSTTLQGQIFKPTGETSFYQFYPGVELTLDGGPGLTFTAVTDENGMFFFKDLPVGNYTLYAQDPAAGTFGSVGVNLTGSVSSFTPGEGEVVVENATLKLTFDDELQIISKSNAPGAVNQPPVTPSPANTPAGGMQGGGGGPMAGGAGGGLGLMAAGLAAAGLATGISAATDNDNNVDRTPVSRGTPGSR